MERFHIHPVYMRMNGPFVHLKKFWVAIYLDVCLTIIKLPTNIWWVGWPT